MRVLSSLSLISILSICLSNTSPALAETQAEPTWKGANIKLRFKDAPDVPMVTGEYIYTTKPNSAGNVTLACMKGQFFAGITTKKEDAKTLFRSAWWKARTKRVRPTLIINGEVQKSEIWAYSKKTGLANPGKRYVSAKIYNAAIRGDDIKLKIDGVKELNLVLPKPNREFAYFGAECGMGSFKKK